MRLVRTVGAVCAAALAWMSCKSQEGPQGGAAGAGMAMPVEVISLSPGEVRDAADYVGTLISRTSIIVYPQVAGYIQSIPVKPGTWVKDQEVLLVVDPRREQAGLRATQAQRASALAQREFARRTQERSAQLLKEGLQSRQDYEQAVAQARQAEASARAIEAQIQSQRVQLGFYEVSAPFAGMVGDFPVKVGDYVTPQTELTTLDQSRMLEVAVQVPVDRARAIQIGKTPVELLDEKDKVVVAAPVFFVAPTPSATTQLVEVRAAFENKEGLRAGEMVRTRVVYEVREALTVPTVAVTQISGQSFVYEVATVDGGTVARRAPLSVGEVTGNDYEVTGGADAGVQVVVSGLQLLRDGQPIKPTPARPAQGQGVGGASDAGQ
ncbi:HAE1 family efflux transporter MFP subunit [Myxococcus stipitatus DSM 14675]|uniref:HAE1 family efflux transporter MFP subunit n=1 Tax=Myxococcus stipitatus (strain DSM 14675 / JCM 12634 / Mx s8) TaxID=1278073 RepID=L7UNK9_MYXSD|nr:efflux RND transporter periplasmic adaptor subunit [Myxococcus stipitatus]AGC49172.1 HAE1 family efflux transporter MFP subunit [Myxococcus stipitatus DSM 14675]